MIVVAILAKDKSATLPAYLSCLYNQTYPKNKIHLYVRTNDNKDNTEDILTEFLNEHRSEYASVYFDSSSVSENLKNYGNHEWNCERFTILGKIRQDSIQYAIDYESHYFVADCDNFIVPSTIEDLFSVSNAGVVSPMLDSTSNYSNFHDDVDANGYLSVTPYYNTIRWRQLQGLIIVKVVHCTYLINNKFLQSICYDDGSHRYEYVIFSSELRKHDITQFLDTRKPYGIVSFATTLDELYADIEHPMLSNYKSLFVDINAEEDTKAPSNTPKDTETDSSSS